MEIKMKNYKCKILAEVQNVFQISMDIKTNAYVNKFNILQVSIRILSTQELVSIRVQCARNPSDLHCTLILCKCTQFFWNRYIKMFK